jgi:hypothetical protein
VVFLMAGVSFVYLALSQSIKTTKELENVQEVLRYSSEVFTRSLKQTTVLPTVTDPTKLAVEHTTPGAIACDGEDHPVPFTETFTLNNGLLTCQVNGSSHDLLTGIEDLNFQQEENSDLVQIFITPKDLTDRTPVGGYRLDIALTSKILIEALNQ